MIRMKLRLPLLAKIQALLLLNLLLLASIFFFVFQLQFRFGLDSLLTGLAGDRVKVTAQVISQALQDKPADTWSSALEQFSKTYKVDFFLMRHDGTVAAGPEGSIPTNILARITERRPGEGLGRGPPPGKGLRRTRDEIELQIRFCERTTSPVRYWIGVQVPLTGAEVDPARPRPLTLLLRSESLHGGGLFFDVRPWIYAAFGALVFSVLLWIPFVRGVTRSLTQMTRVAGHLAEGQFQSRAEEHRYDEIGQLGNAINRMAVRLDGLLTGQKRFLSDVAHELCSPLARMQMALGILESRHAPAASDSLQDLREEVEEMSSLIHELLSFSKADLARHHLQLVSVELSEIAHRVVTREGLKPEQFQLAIAEGIAVMAEPNLLARALGNLVRNAVRYAGQVGPVTLSATSRADHVVLTVRDRGPGVPEAELQRIFDPFFRGEPSRSRDSGGVGLGLAIVKTCVEACSGSVSARNCTPTGFEVELRLRPAN